MSLVARLVWNSCLLVRLLILVPLDNKNTSHFDKSDSYDHRGLSTGMHSPQSRITPQIIHAIKVFETGAEERSPYRGSVVGVVGHDVWSVLRDFGWTREAECHRPSRDAGGKHSESDWYEWGAIWKRDGGKEIKHS